MKIALLLILSIPCIAQHAALPSAKLTPGAIRTTNEHDICSTKTSKLRHVTAGTKKAVFAEYKLDWSTRKNYEVDHLLSLEIGGSNDILNLWPQPYAVPGAHQKDVLENKFHRMICNGEISPTQAQKEITKDWYAAYRKYVRKDDAHLGR